jgi:hypothetical protein
MVKSSDRVKDRVIELSVSIRPGLVLVLDLCFGVGKC